MPVVHTSNYTLRAAQPDDIPQILQLMRDMAEFEQLLDQFHATEHSLQQNIFTSPAAVNCLVIETRCDQPILVSYIMWFHNYSSFMAKQGLYLEDIYIAPEHRRQGLGTLVLQHLAQIAVERDCGRFEWVVLDWNQTAIDFYEQLGATVLPEWRIVRLSGAALHQLANQATPMKQVTQTSYEPTRQNLTV
ncbi:MAG TPA: GNAT family N-acetyltransferase [Candidatus Paenalcaligenes intestinipullorum]|uniref:GNAT family N-acetyltransferase n=1 Tax=Candidatus Paenalcaligenes intestinipullorum TaxID=2838718 RepID=A0A9D2RI42_9BURK|nr:GNAT family N-acetyltransferase [Candidatus Paenalcaligenes intestinipullorum]